MVLAPFFSNLLPEGPLRRYLAERAGVKEQREFFLLHALGADLPGALTVRLAGPRELAPYAEGEEEDDRRRDPRRLPRNALRFSLAGVQLKFSALEEPRGGLTIPACGTGGAWIVKLPSREFEGVPENEFAMMELARRIGIDVPEARLIDTESIGGLPDGSLRAHGQALAIARFDRPPKGPVHFEDFAQVFSVPPDRKYERASYRHIAGVIWAESGEKGAEEFIRRLVFNTLIGNADMHLKNWAMIYPDKRSAAIAPAYDFVSTIAYIEDDTAALRYSRTKKMSEFDADELKHLAAKARLPEKLVMDAARETAAAFLEAWHQERANLPLTIQAVETIDRHIRRMPIATA